MPAGARRASRPAETSRDQPRPADGGTGARTVGHVTILTMGSASSWMATEPPALILPSRGRVQMSQPPNSWYRGGDVSLSLGERYEQALVPTIFAPWAVDLMARAAPQPGERIL